MRKKFATAMIVLAMTACCFIMPAEAASTAPADPQTLIKICSEETGVPATLDAMVDTNILTSAEKTLITKNNAITRAVAYRVLLPLFGIYPYPASLYPEIVPADQCVDDYANARCAAIILGLTAETDNPIQVMTASELDALLAALRKGVSLPYVETGIPYVDSVEIWDRTTYEGRNSMIEAYTRIPKAWLTDFEAQGWKFVFELPVPANPDQVLANYSVAGVTRYGDKIIQVGRSQAKVTLHELTHYIVKQAGITKAQMDEAALAEKSKLKGLLGQYSQTKSTEYVPEFVAYWLEHPDQQDTLKAMAPLSAQLAETLVSWTA